MIDPTTIIHSDDVIQHFGTKGMKWGVRKNYMSDKHALKNNYKRSLKKSKENFKGKRPDFWRRFGYKASVASMYGGLLTGNNILTRYGAMGIGAEAAMRSMDGSHFYKSKFKRRNKAIKKAYKKAKKELKTSYKKEMKVK
jgi:hypothetical protein|nr:MAG TPA: hypothetical protein [Caudoviricetes sp.]